eukprot:TRINITY_DN1447_c0_g1_i1.p1 TRINITY_DN1447_c0_g1~~TRINITY_DN1447_c0_g1_i1.p1  ORF type:complete len:212 (-),score=12.46 TRINITY_DN1447_c0_g1_i1:160-741(-)
MATYERVDGTLDTLELGYNKHHIQEAGEEEPLSWPRSGEEWRAFARSSRFKTLALNFFILLVACGLATGELNILHNSTCDFIFRCGCTWNWAGGWDKCNVHNASGPKCPWCLATPAQAWTTSWLVLILMWLSAFLVSFARPRIFQRYERTKAWTIYVLALIIIPFVMYCISSLIVAYGFKLSSGYPYFLWNGP